MCGRFTLATPKDELEDQLQLSFPEYELSYNTAPSQHVLAIVANRNEYRTGFLQWGLVPAWEKDSKNGFKMINARAETLDKKPAFKKLLSHRRCLIPADSFYEWKKQEDGSKQPFRIIRSDRKIMTFAGLWDRWKMNDQELVTCTIITTRANKMISPIHERMPVILDEEARRTWLDHTITDPSILKYQLIPYHEGHLTAYKVSSLVNNARNNLEECMAPLS
ncbi:SOS response-associated peptidase [Alkalihalobacillus pseudalcaliphilus]|uniref:SOS response-associated peptidase n=1 Tax=Alkalihalobacillus pseudalcaliphilus TaxID=79884 RepID=UPI00064E1272|nr:SOS response-associated peptidase [Alkalihalobacillus pseudalcaliphilus]KMK74973.1 hypothetical protein AB990_15970 [Alkalihalobacillus pseudalcaliphilus]